MLAQVRHFVSYSSSLLAKTIESSGGDPVLLVSVLEAGDAADAMAALAERCSGEPTLCQWRAACDQMGRCLAPHLLSIMTVWHTPCPLPSPITLVP